MKLERLELTRRQPWNQGRMIDGEISYFQTVRSIDFDGVFYCARAAGEVWRKQYETGLSATGKKLQNYRAGSFIATASMSGHIANIPQLQTAVRSTPTRSLIYQLTVIVQRRQSWRHSYVQVSGR